MLATIIRFALRFRGVIYALAVLLAGYGLYTLTRSQLDVFPEFAPPMAIVQTEAKGLSSEQVETLVTQPIENTLAGAPGMKTLRSKSLQGLSVVTMTFDERTDVLQARQLVAERLNALAASLPSSVEPPALLPLTTSTNIVLMVGLTSPSRSLMALHDIAEWTLKPQLLAVPGVADAVVFGGQTRQLQIQVDPAQLLRYRLSLRQVADAARAATGVRGAGFIENGNQRITLQSEGQNLTPAALARVVLRWSHGAGIRIGDVAKVLYAPATEVGAASVAGKPGVILVLESQYGANTLTTTRGLDRALARITPELERRGVTLHSDIFRPANFIDQATHHLRNVLLAGAGLVIVVLFLFLLNVRTAAISAVAIPLSLLAAAIVLHKFGVSLNTMTLGGLAIALGEVVDDAIIDVENIYRRLRENRAAARPLPALRVVLRASVEVRSAVVFATFIVILIFLPVITLTGVAGKLFAPLGIAYILAVVTSLVVALTLTPAMALGLLASGPLPPHEPHWVARMKSRYHALLGSVERRSRASLVAVALCCVAAAALLPFFRGNFIPELHEGHYIVHVGLAPGTSLRATMRIGARISRALLKIPGVRQVAQTAGRASKIVDPAGVQLSEIEVDLKPMGGAGQERALHAMQAMLARLPGVTASVNTFLVERIDETISGATAPVVVNVFGPSLDVIDRKAQEIAQLLGSIRGAASIRLQSPPGTPELSIRLRQEQLARRGFEPLQVLDAIHEAYQGITATQVYQGNQVHDVTVVLPPAVRTRVSQVGELMLRNPDGQAVPLKRLAEIRQVVGRYQITHSDGQRMQTISVNLGSRAASDYVKEAQARIAREIVLPKGTFIEFAGESQARAQSLRDLLVHGAMALVGIALLLFLALRSRRGVALIMASLPFALVGGVLSVALAGGDLSLGAMVGFVTLFGISLRNAIMLISHYEHLVHVDRQPWNMETALRGASERLVPILMTALVTALALLPLALTGGAPGNEIEGPMAIVILGGLITSTLLNVLVLPTVALRYGKFDQGAPADQLPPAHAPGDAQA